MVRKPNGAAPEIVVGMAVVPSCIDRAVVSGPEVGVHGIGETPLVVDRPCRTLDRNCHVGDDDLSTERVGPPGDGPWPDGAGNAGSGDGTSEYECFVTLAAESGSSDDRVSVPGSPSLDDFEKKTSVTDIEHVADRLMSHVDDAGLLGGEVEGLLGLNIGEWLIYRTGRPVGSMTPVQHDRARLAVEMLDLLSDRHGTWPAVVAWLIRPSSTLDDLTPLEWASESAEHLHAVVRALREFAL